MKRRIACCLLLISFCIVGCTSKKNNVDSPSSDKIDFTCNFNDNYILDCDNEYTSYDEHNNLINITSNNYTENFSYEYDNCGNIILFQKESEKNKKIVLHYDEENRLSSFEIVTNHTIDDLDIEETKTKYEYIYDNDNKITKIMKAFGYNNNDYEYLQDNEITYEYFNENGIDYVKEINNQNGIKTTRIFLLDYMNIYDNVLFMINYLPNNYYEKLEYYPNYNFRIVNNTNFDTPIFVPIIKSLEATDINGKNISKTNYYFDSKNRFITDDLSDGTIVNYFVENNNDIVTRYTIYKDTNYSSPSQITNYYTYKTEYIYENNKLIKFIKYEQKQILKDVYENLKKSYLEQFTF